MLIISFTTTTWYGRFIGWKTIKFNINMPIKYSNNYLECNSGAKFQVISTGTYNNNKIICRSFFDSNWETNPINTKLATTTVHFPKWNLNFNTYNTRFISLGICDLVQSQSITLCQTDMELNWNLLTIHGLTPFVDGTFIQGDWKMRGFQPFLLLLIRLVALGIIGKKNEWGKKADIL